jgi:hypothetical protein
VLLVGAPSFLPFLAWSSFFPGFGCVFC